MQNEELQLTLLGAPRAAVGDTGGELGTRKWISILAYIALSESGAVRRDRLLNQFFDSPDDTHALEVEVSNLNASLRRVTGMRRVVDFDGECKEYKFCCNVQQPDVHALETLVDELRPRLAQGPARIDEECRKKLLDARALCRGRFLEGAARPSQWVTDKREELDGAIKFIDELCARYRVDVDTDGAPGAGDLSPVVDECTATSGMQSSSVPASNHRSVQDAAQTVVGGSYSPALESSKAVRDRPKWIRRLDDARRVLAERVYDHWIMGFLAPALEMNSQLGRPFPSAFLVIGEDGTPVAQQPITPFAGANDRAIITGNPGTGKTLLMLEHVRDLIDQCRLAPSAPCPVVLSAAGWFDPQRHGLSAKEETVGAIASSQRTVATWAQDELVSHYGLSPSAARALTADNRTLVYCLDGVDQVGCNYAGEAENDVDFARKVQKAFWRTLRDFDRSTEHLARVLITVDSGGLAGTEGWLESPCRSISVTPTDGQAATDWIRDCSEPLFQLMEANDELREKLLCDRFTLQLVVANSMGLHLPDLEKIFHEKGGDGFIEHFVNHHLYERFSEWRNSPCSWRARLTRRSLTDGDIKRYVSRIASYIGGAGAFRLDEISPQDLHKSLMTGYRRQLAIVLILSIALLAGAPPAIGIAYAWIARGQLLRALLRGAAVLLTITLAGGGIGGITYSRLNGQSGTRAAAGMFYRALALGVAFGLGRAAVVLAAPAVIGHGARAVVATQQLVICAIIATLAFWGFLYRMHDDPLQIRLAERKNDLNLKIVSIILLAGAGIGIATTGGSLAGLPRGLAFGICLPIALAVFVGRSRGDRPERVRPNEGVRSAARHALLWSGVVSFVCSIIFGIVFWLNRHSPVAGWEAGIEACSFMVMFYFFDGLSVVKHCALRLTLRKAGYVAPHYLQVLDAAAYMGLLRVVGGGYVFPNNMTVPYLLRHWPPPKPLRWRKR